MDPVLTTYCTTICFTVSLNILFLSKKTKQLSKQSFTYQWHYSKEIWYHKLHLYLSLHIVENQTEECSFVTSCHLDTHFLCDKLQCAKVILDKFKNITNAYNRTQDDNRRCWITLPPLCALVREMHNNFVTGPIHVAAPFLGKKTFSCFDIGLYF